jgi:ribosomal protein S18 acetylase RimI-like enzyme
MMKNTTVDMYLEFRRELDKMWVPVALENTDCIEQITYNGKTVGIICGSPSYIDCVYVMPEYRKKGLAKQAVLEYYERYGKKRLIRLHIINNNTAAQKFWNSIFELKPLEWSLTDTLYEIVCRK